MIHLFEQQYRYIGAKIIYYRKLRRMTQEELSFKASISSSYLSRIERGAYTNGLPVSTLMKIAEALNVDIAKLFNRDI